MHAPFITVDKLQHHYREGDRAHPVLRELTLSLETGEIVALLGRSGSGKSTLLNLLAGIDRADSGDIRIAGRDLARLSERERTLFRRRHIGFIYQFFQLLPTLTVAENVALPLELNGHSAAHSEQAAQVLLSALDIGRLGARFPDQLSGGEQQRAAIARALIHDPDLVLADEPTGNLDARTGRQVLRLLEQQVRREGCTMIVATHSRAVADCADRVLVLEDGRLQERGGDFIW